MRIDVITLFPTMFSEVINESIIKRAQEKDMVEFYFHDFRTFSTNKHHKVDDYPYGGGVGMVLCVQPIYDCLTSIKGYQEAMKILLTPQGTTYKQSIANELCLKDHLILICGHYEGFDERVRTLVDVELSIGDYVLTGGEIGAMVIIDSVVRLLPSVLNKKESFLQDSFYNGMLEHPHYTRPQSFMGMDVPEVLLSGNHQKISKWRENESIKRTKERRPDLLTEKE